MKTPQQQAADLRKWIAHCEHAADNAPAFSSEKRANLFWAKKARKDLQRLKDRYKHIPDL
jgi:hypothetical protein